MPRSRKPSPDAPELALDFDQPAVPRPLEGPLSKGARALLQEAAADLSLGAKARLSDLTALLGDIHRSHHVGELVDRGLATVVKYGRHEHLFPTPEGFAALPMRPEPLPPPPQTRPCMCCGRPFQSLDRRKHRLCDRCNDAAF